MTTSAFNDRGPLGGQEPDGSGSSGATGRQAKKARSRRRILDAAREIFFRDGFMEANLDDVARGAGVAKGTLYRYFENKAELYVAVLAMNGEIFAEKLRAAGSGEDPAPERIRRMAHFYFEHWIQNREYFQIFWAIENQPIIGELPAGVLDEVMRVWEKCMRICAEVVQAGIDAGVFRPCDPREASDILWTLANALIQTDASRSHRELRSRPLADTYRSAIDLVLEGLCVAGVVDTFAELGNSRPGGE